jgi:carbon starvation protein
MTGLLLVVIAALLLGIGGTVYSRFLARQFGEDRGRPTPAIRRNDGRDFVPTPTPVVFGHHFASIAGAGPIVGPVLAMCYGWGPAVLWIVIGGLLIGGVHDYLAAFMSMREDGQSMATIARRLLGRGPFIGMMIFLVLMLGLVTASFLNLSASALVSTMDLGRMRLPEGQTMFRVVEDHGAQKVVIGGIASMSVIVITTLAPLVGWMYIKKKVAVWKCSLVAIALCAVSILVGLHRPVAFPDTMTFAGLTIAGTTLWKILLSAYVLVAAGVPVWVFLQSRDFINVHILYTGMALLLVTLVVAALRSGGADSPPLPVFDAQDGGKYLGLFWPALFITIACGAVSGFHSLCAGGTTSKQLSTEAAARRIGYWAMLLESLLAVLVVGMLVVGTTKANYFVDVFPVNKDQNPVLGFAAAVGNAGRVAFGLPSAAGALAAMLMLEGFLITTLDTAVRLNRYLLEEIWRELFGRYDVFAARAASSEAAQVLAGAEVPAGSGGVPDAVSVPTSAAPRRPIVTRRVGRAALQLLGQYWVNSGLAVLLMLYLSVSGQVVQLWSIFGTSNQLLAAFALGIGTVWLLRRGKKVWYIIVPAVFMILTTAASLIQLLPRYFPRVEQNVAKGSSTLFVVDILLMGLTGYLVVAGALEIVALMRRREAPRAVATVGAEAAS